MRREHANILSNAATGVELCSGLALDDHTVVTAAHCVEVRMGMNRA